jgi:hypothetical protein
LLHFSASYLLHFPSGRAAIDKHSTTGFGMAGDAPTAADYGGDEDLPTFPCFDR